MDLQAAFEVAEHTHRSTDAELLEAEAVLAPLADKDGESTVWEHLSRVQSELDGNRVPGARQQVRDATKKVERLRRDIEAAHKKLADAEAKVEEAKRRQAALAVRAPKPRPRRWYTDGTSKPLRPGQRT